MRNFFFLKISILCSRQERAYLIFCGTGTRLWMYKYGPCVHEFVISNILMIGTFVFILVYFIVLCILFCIFKITTGHNIYIKLFHVHSYAFSFPLLRFYPIQSIYKYLHFIHMMYRDDINT